MSFETKFGGNIEPSSEKIDQYKPEKELVISEINAGLEDAMENDKKNSELEIDKARVSIFSKFSDIFKGKEKSKEERKEADMKKMLEFIKDLTTRSSFGSGGSFGAGIDFDYLEGDAESKEILLEILNDNGKINKIGNGPKKVEMIKEKKKKIFKLRRIIQEGIENKYKSFA